MPVKSTINIIGHVNYSSTFNVIYVPSFVVNLFMNLRKHYLLFFLAFFSSNLAVRAQFHNGYQMTFGKNRVQFDERFWSFMKFKNFDTYYYLGGLELAKYTGIIADRDLAAIEQTFDYTLEGKIQFIIYNKLSDAKQSNIGLETDDNTNNIGGVTKIVGNKVFLYFDGNHENFRQQIRAGIARVLIDQIMYGGDIRDRIQNAALLSLPDWYINGLVDYIARPWNTQLDDKMRDGILSGQYFKFNQLNGNDALVAGHSLWKYITDLYTEKAISSLLYMTRVNRNIESGFLYVLGTSNNELAQNWRDAMLRYYSGSDNGTQPIEANIFKKTKKHLIYNQIKLNADASHLSYVTNELGKYKVYLRKLDKNKGKKKILKGGFKSFTQQTDESYPILAWHPSGKLLAIIREKKGKILLGFYNLEEKKYTQSPIFNFEKILSAAYADDGQSLLMSAIQKGQSDIYIYNLRSRTYTQITKDLFDDLQPRFVNGMKGIVFASNRTNDTLGADRREFPSINATTDIFYYDLANKSPLLKRVSNTPYSNESLPMPYNADGFCYLSDESGINNRYFGKVDSALAYIDTVEHYRLIITTEPLSNYPRNIVEQDINFINNKISQLFNYNGKTVVNIIASNEIKPTSSKIERTDYRINIAQNDTINQGTTNNLETEPTVKDSSEINIDNYVFQTEFPKSKSKKEKKKNDPIPSSPTILPNALNADSAFVFPKQRNYETAFGSNYLVSQLDNTLLNGTYQVFTGGGAVFFNPGLNGFFKIGISDLLEDYRMTGGFRLAADLNSNEYFVSYENLKHRLDKQLTFYRQGRLVGNGFVNGKIHTHELRYANKWPFSDVAALKGSVSYRNDRLVILATDNFSLREPNQLLNWASGRLEYVVDNTINKGLNLYNGTRMKIFAEYYRQVDEKVSGMYVLGTDVRHYIKIHRDIIWANRIAASASFGQEKLIYYLGATDNWLVPRFNEETVIDPNQPYAYQALATNLRGFDQNIRNGSNFALINSELRFPIFKYFIKRPIRSDFIRNFQVIGFADVGTAWNGWSPYDSTSALNRRIISNGTFDITIISQNEPIVGGYGFGLRSRLLGYFIRADWAYGIENRERKARKFYLSFSLDF